MKPLINEDVLKGIPEHLIRPLLAFRYHFSFVSKFQSDGDFYRSTNADGNLLSRRWRKVVRH